MNREETLALYAQGREAWNKWANEMLAERKRLEEAGEWEATQNNEGSLEPQNAATQTWYDGARADFNDSENIYHFEQDANFSYFIFPTDLNFNHTTFWKNANFDNATFVGHAKFDNAVFIMNAEFEGATFGEDARFQNISFRGDTKFEKVIFFSLAWFDQAKFDGNVRFSHATFNKNAWLDQAKFSGNAWFDKTIFNAQAWFANTSFRKDVQFNNSNFRSDTNFSNIFSLEKPDFHTSNFKGPVNFSYAELEKGIILSSSTFKNTHQFHNIISPGRIDFSNSHFINPPDFSNIETPTDISIDNAIIKTPSLIFSLFKKVDPTLSTRFRRYKAYAIKDHDNFSEHNFFIGELVGTLLSRYGKLNPIIWFGCLYELLSRFGTSVLRPLFAWVALTAMVTTLHIYAHTSGQDNCNITNSAFHVAVKTGSLGLIQDPSKRIVFVRDYTCLYGTHNDKRETPKIPPSILFVEGVQALLSAILIFLLLLGLRNNFKLK